ATTLGARAFALGRDVAFAPGEWRPGTVDGRKLLAHELVHVLQHEKGAPAALRRYQPPPPPRPPPVRLPPRVIVPPRTAPQGSPGTGNAPAPAPGAPDSAGRSAREQPSDDLYEAFERGSRIMADENDATAEGEFPRATLDRGGSPPDYISQGPPGAAQTPTGTVHFRTRRFHVLDALEAATRQARTLADLAQVVSTYIGDSQRGRILVAQIAGTESFAKPENGQLRLLTLWGGGASADPGGTRRMELFATVAEPLAAAKPIAATLAQYKTWADQIHVRVKRVEGDCTFTPIRPHAGGNARHNAYATHVTGSQDDVHVRTPEGIVAQYDGIDPNRQVWEVKTRYGYLRELQVVVDLDNRYRRFTQIIDELEEQRARGVYVAARCGLKFAYAFDDKAVAMFMGRQWGGIPPVHHYAAPAPFGPVAPENKGKP
ncbi:MAG: DUF4157 domain-containing protein, partial [Geminicoccaceae bacterium]